MVSGQNGLLYVSLDQGLFTGTRLTNVRNTEVHQSNSWEDPHCQQRRRNAKEQGATAAQGRARLRSSPQATVKRTHNSEAHSSDAHTSRAVTAPKAQPDLQNYTLKESKRAIGPVGHTHLDSWKFDGVDAWTE